MIRLIASDLDGTLLNSQRQLPKDFFSVIDRLNQLGVLFIAASGRSYPTLRRDFAPHSDELCFISDNGARIAEHGKILQKDPIPPQVVSQVLETCASLPEVKPVLTSDRGTYANTKGEPWFHDCILAYFDNYQQVDDLSSVHEDFYKISLCDRAGAVKNSFRLMPQSLRDSAAAASAARRERIAVAAGGAGETGTELLGRAKALNSERVVLAAPGGVSEKGTALSGLTAAAAVAGAIAGQGDPAVPLGGAELLGLNGLSTQYGDNDIDLLVRGGVTPLDSRAGTVSVVRGITTRTRSGESEDATWRELSTVLIVDDVIPAIRESLRARFRRAKNGASTVLW